MAISVPQTSRPSELRERAPAAVRLAAAVLLVLLAAAALAALGLTPAIGPAAVVLAMLALVAIAGAERRARRALELENRRLTAAAARATLELRGSRARIAASAERERRRIERDLHDGAQQRLVALRIELELAEELVAHDPRAAVARLGELEREVEFALDELRELAHGVHPPLLADRGLAEALRAHVAHAALPVTVTGRPGRHAPEVESAVYFCVLEAVQNACKHAAGARRVEVALDLVNGLELRATVVDDGAGPPDGGAVPGAGITNMRDRLAAVGGRLELASAPSGGMEVRIVVPQLLPLTR